MKGSIRRRGTQSWELRFDVGRDSTTGRRRQHMSSFKGTKREAQDKLRGLMQEAQHGGWADAGTMTVGDYLNRWQRDHAAAEVSAKTSERYAELIRLQIIPHIGAVALAKLEPGHVQTLRTKLLTEGRKRVTGRTGKAPPRGLSAQTVKHVYRVLRRALKQAVKLHLIRIDPTDAVDPPKVARIEIKVLDDADARKVLTAAKGTQLYMPILIALATGLRRGELLALTWDNIDFPAGTLSVRQSLEETATGLRFKQPKTPRSRRMITLPALAVGALRAYKKAQGEERMRLGVRGEFDNLVFSTRDPVTMDTKPLRPRNVTKEFTRICKRAAVAGVSFHALRHTHITNLLRSNVHPKIASERAGHSSVAITLDVYSHAVPNMQADAAMLVDGHMHAVLDDE